MKKFIITLFAMIITMIPAFADIQPWVMDDIPKSAIGLFQANTNIKLYEKPDLKSEIIFDKSWHYKQPLDKDSESLFAIFMPAKELSYIYVTDVDEDWVEILYDKKNNLRGWIKKEDEFQFMPWISFYNLYGRKYGLRLLKDSPDSIKEIYSGTENASQLLGKIKMPKTIRLTTIKGNWALVSVLDIDRIPKTGFVRWRSKDGDFYMFPAMK
ncbi:hypothetical protein IJI31_03495 [bacterium]|nr:hypothetical protein [bacterium]